MALQRPQFDEMRRIGGGGGGGEDEFAGLGGSFAAAGGGGEFMASYLQNRISGLNRSTVSPRVNQMRVMKSPEFALAKTLGVSTAYNSGGSQVDVQRARQRLNSPSSMERDAAQGQLDKFYERNKNVPLNPVLEGAGFNPAKPQDYAGPVGNQDAFDEIQKRFGRSGERKQEVPQTRTPGQGGSSTPTIPASGDQTATPPSVKDAQNATRAPIGAPTVGAGGSQTLDSLPATTPSKETTKGPRLDTSREPQATGYAGTFEGGQQARRDADQRLRNDLSDEAMRKRAQAGGRYVGPAPALDQDGINAANNRRDEAQRNYNANPVGPTGIAYDADAKIAVAKARNQAQDDREKIKKDYNLKADQYYGQMDRNRAAFGNPYGPDGGKTAELRQQQKTPELAPLGGYDEKYVVGQRGGDPSAKRGEPGYMEKEVVPVGPMTNRPAANKEEYDARMKRFEDEGVRQAERNKEAAMKKAEDAEMKQRVAQNQKNVEAAERRLKAPQFGRRA